MKLRITHAAQTDLENLFAWIAAERVIERILAALERLRDHPRLGHEGRLAGAYELIVKRTPYIAVYRAAPDEVVILRVRHGSRAWPPAR